MAQAIGLLPDRLSAYFVRPGLRVLRACVIARLSDRWRQEGLGETRLALGRDAKAPALFVKGSGPAASRLRRA